MTPAEAITQLRASHVIHAEVMSSVDEALERLREESVMRLTKARAHELLDAMWLATEDTGGRLSLSMYVFDANGTSEATRDAIAEAFGMETHVNQIDTDTVYAAQSEYVIGGPNADVRFFVERGVPEILTGEGVKTFLTPVAAVSVPDRPRIERTIAIIDHYGDHPDMEREADNYHLDERCGR